MNSAQIVSRLLDHCGDCPEDAPADRKADAFNEPQDTRSEVDRLLPTKQYTLRGSTMIYAPGIIQTAQSEWQYGNKKRKKWAMGIMDVWQGLPEDVKLKVLSGEATIDAQGNDAVITVKLY